MDRGWGLGLGGGRFNPLALPVYLQIWNKMARKRCLGIGFGDVLRSEGTLGEGRGPWDVQVYSGPTEFILGDRDLYEQMVRMHLRNEKRRMKHRLREIGRHRLGKSWDGPVPTALETRWYEWSLTQQPKKKKVKKNVKKNQTKKPVDEEERAEEKAEESPDDIVDITQEAYEVPPWDYMWAYN